MTEQVLVVVDGHEQAHQAIPPLRRISAGGRRCTVEVLYVLDGCRAIEADPARLGQELESAWGYVRRQARKLRLPGVEPKATLVLGSVERTLAGRLEHGGFRQVVVAARPGSPERTAMRRLLAHQAAAHARRPRVFDALPVRAA